MTGRGIVRTILPIGSQRRELVEQKDLTPWRQSLPFDKNKVRIADGWITLDNLTPGQAVKFQTTVHALGTPASVELAANSVPAELQPLAPPKKVSITVNSVPQGATLSVDGTEAGTTPKLVQLVVGKHSLAFTKEGFNTLLFPSWPGRNRGTCPEIMLAFV
jgi:PEGA domain